MWVRILSEWAGSPRCGQVADLPDALVADRIRAGLAEAVLVPAVTDAVAHGPETAMAEPGVQAVLAKGKGRKRGV